jgi:hypothetical protein
VQAASPAPALQATTKRDAYDLLAQVLSSKGRFSLELSEQLRRIYRAYATAAGKSSLEDCHGWKPEPGNRSRVRLMAEAAQFAAIVDAYRALPACETLSTMRRCEILHGEMIDFECNYWPQWSKDGLPADRTSGVLEALYRAYKALPNKPPAKSAAGIYRLLTRAGVADAS